MEHPVPSDPSVREPRPAQARIGDVEVFDIRLPLRREWRWRGMHEDLGRWSLVRVATDAGVAGWGEATALGSWGGDLGRYHGETPGTVRHVVGDLLGPAIAGLDPFARTEVRARMDAALRGHPYAKAAIEMALWDLQGKLTGLPVATLLGGPVRPGVPVAHMIGIMGIEDGVREATLAAEEGVTTFQLKGTGDPARDVDLVRAVRQAAGPSATLRLDANQGYRHLGVKGAVRVVRRLEEAGADMVEQPTEGLAQMAGVRAAVGATIVADESCWQPADVVEIDRHGAADAISIYVAKAGGIDGARRVADLAETLGLPCDVNGSLESGIGNAANLQFAVAAPAVRLACVIPITSLEEAGATAVAGRYFADDVVAEPFRFEDGLLRPPPGPGLGIEVDEDKVARYAVPAT